MMANLVLWNDDFNAYDHVIQTLVIGLDKTFKESEFLTFLVHIMGSAIVKIDNDPEKLKNALGVLKDNGLNATIEEKKSEEKAN